MEGLPKKSNKSAVVIIPPEDIWPQIQEIRSVHDKSFRRWMPHINLLYPFVEDDRNRRNFGYAAEKIKELITRNQLQRFDLVFDKTSFNYFKHKSSCTLWLSPCSKSSETCGDLLKIQQLLQEEFPGFNDLSKVSPESGYTPHLSLGQFSHLEIENNKASFQETWKTLKFVVNDLCLISRKNFDSPFEIIHRIGLL